MKKQNQIPASNEVKTTENTSEIGAKEVKFQPLAPEVQELITKLKQENASLQAQLIQGPQSLEEKIKFFQAKQAKIEKLNRLDGFAESLIKIGEDVQESMGDNDFSSDKYSVAVTRKDYSHSNPNRLLDINNPVLVVEVLGYALERINSKRSLLRSEIEA